MEILATFILTAILVVLFIYFNSKNVVKKAQTKLNIINQYKNALLEILKEHNEDKDLQTRNKIEFLKKVNQELSMNIFFEKYEVKIILEELSKMEQE
ncbi:hypothetical protein ACNSOS_11575 [Aliarcobacter vitoriensis]|uniref:Uncharacterized protein n=1 Tax=Aliarcobacter vitoriensis TaxID=2011099 RepID=A0A366MT07_9BACT|nr:hypothetical protein [Aliarcobacter vitoriensis]RBQ29187.1 hypothetical protein CRU91_04985 [Aliarcobacter vitoriensis]RBQ30412.1 hypothetical protein CRU92_12285 [Arcobacter sp. FW59]